MEQSSLLWHGIQRCEKLERHTRTRSRPANVIVWQLKPSGTEGYRTAEVTLCGVDTDQLSSKTMECKTQPGLFFVGEVVDVTGHLGGYNFQWAHWKL